MQVQNKIIIGLDIKYDRIKQLPLKNMVMKCDLVLSKYGTTVYKIYCSQASWWYMSVFAIQSVMLLLFLFRAATSSSYCLLE